MTLNTHTHKKRTLIIITIHDECSCLTVSKSPEMIWERKKKWMMRYYSSLTWLSFRFFFSTAQLIVWKCQNVFYSTAIIIYRLQWRNDETSDLNTFPILNSSGESYLFSNFHISASKVNNTKCPSCRFWPRYDIATLSTHREYVCMNPTHLYCYFFFFFFCQFQFLRIFFWWGYSSPFHCLSAYQLNFCILSLWLAADWFYNNELFRFFKGWRVVP